MPEQPLEQSIFLQALELGTPAEREAYLRGACGSNETLRAAVAELLAAHKRAGNILDAPPGGPVAAAATAACQLPTAAAAEAAGAAIGPYKLLEAIGEGGMGTVWMAQQIEPVKRLVALKLIKAGMDSKQVIARFEAERQALALMDHPNIAKVFDAGAVGQDSAPDRKGIGQERSPDLRIGRPYFVMELVKGQPITKYCDEHHLTPRQRLELFLPVCQAIQHAHQKGVIHRDLKPSNVLVALYDGKPVPKVIDFGVAKAMGQPLTEHTLVTGFGNIVGTLEYMSPEQAEINQLDIDTRSDIYSLGVLLYELLTGSPPFTRKELEKAGMLEMLRVIREQEPSKPSTKLSTAEGLPTLAANRGTEPAKLTKLVRGELDWIVMKALEKDRNRRYETANGFAMDVQRYLADEAVQACPPSVGYRLRKFVRRNRGPVLAATLVLGALIAGIVGTSWGLIRVEKAREDAVIAQLAEADRAEGERRAKNDAQKAAEAERKARQDESVQRRRAEDNAKLAFAVMDDIINGVQQRLTLSVKDEAKGPARNPELEKLEGEILRKTLAVYEKLAQSNATEWTGRRQRARAYSTVGLLQLHYQDFAESEKAYRQAIDLMEKLAEERPDDFDNRFHLADTCHWFYRPFLDSNRLQPAEETTRHALALLEKLVADFPDRRPQIQDFAAQTHRNLGQVLRKAGKLPEAQKAFEQAVAIRTGLVEANPKHTGYRSGLANDRGYLADVLGQIGLAFDEKGQPDEAEKFSRAALSVSEKLADEFPTVAQYRQNVAWQSGKIGEYAAADHRSTEAEKCFRRAIGGFEKLAADFPTVPFYRQEVANSYRLLAHILEEGRPARGAENACRQALALHEQLAAQFPADPGYRVRLYFNLHHLAQILRRQGKGAEAEAKLREAGGLKPDFAAANLNVDYFVGGWWKPVAAARFYADLFTADPKLVRFRFRAACYAARAGCGQGTDANQLDGAERSRLRRQALDWLRVDLAAWGQLLDKEPDRARARVRQALRHWQQNADFAALRGDALTKLPEAERRSWQQLWADVEQTLRKLEHQDTK